MPGTYNGGSTVISPWKPFPRDPTEPTQPPEPKKPICTLTQQQLLDALGVSRKCKDRGSILKELCREGVLLVTGLPNPKHPKVVALLKKRR